MTISDLTARARAAWDWVRGLPSTALLLAALGVAVWLLIVQWQAKDAARAELGRATEREEKLKGLNIAQGVTVDDLRRAKDYALDALAKELERRGVSSDPVVTVHGTTGPVHAGGDGVAQAPQAAPASAPAGTPSPAGAGPACLLSAGDEGEIRVSGGAVRTKAGNVVVTGRADAYALKPERLLFGGPVSLDVAYLKPDRLDRGPGIGIGAALVATRHGFSAGPALAAPPLRFLGLQFEPSTAATFGHGGEWAATGQVIVRRSR